MGISTLLGIIAIHAYIFKGYQNIICNMNIGLNIIIIHS